MEVESNEPDRDRARASEGARARATEREREREREKRERERERGGKAWKGAIGRETHTEAEWTEHLHLLLHL